MIEKSKKVIFIILARTAFIWKFSYANKTQINRKLENVFTVVCFCVPERFLGCLH